MKTGIRVVKGLQRLFTIGTLATLCLAGAPRAGSADPVTLSYAVTINTRCVMGACSAFNSSFNVQVTFDSQIVDQGSSPTGAFSTYGQPRFSPIPLPRPGIDVSATPTLSMSAQEGWQDNPFSPPRYNFFAIEEYAFDTTATTNEWSTVLSHSLFVTEPPSLSPGTLASRLAALGPAEFTYFFTQNDRLTGDLNPGTIGYRGTAQIANVAAVPEPASLLLLGSGIAGLAAWRRRTTTLPAR